MSKTVNISVPANIAVEAKQVIRKILRTKKDGKTSSQVKESRQQIKNNEGQVLNSLKDLR